MSQSRFKENMDSGHCYWMKIRKMEAELKHMMSGRKRKIMENIYGGTTIYSLLMSRNHYAANDKVKVLAKMIRKRPRIWQNLKE